MSNTFLLNRNRVNLALLSHEQQIVKLNGETFERIPVEMSITSKKYNY